MRKIYILVLVLLGACTSNNLAYLEDKQTLNGNTELLKVNSDICNQFKSTDKEFYSCGSGFSSDLELAKSKSAITIGITGFNGGKLKDISDYSVNANVNDMQISEDIHLIWVHIMMKCFES